MAISACCRRSFDAAVRRRAGDHGRRARWRRRSRRRAAGPRDRATTGAISVPQRSSSCSIRSRSSSSVQVERPEGAGGDAVHPDGQALGRVVAGLLDVDGLCRARPTARARTRRTRRGVGVRRQQLLGHVVPHGLEPFGLAERRRRRIVVGEVEQAVAVVGVSDQRLERLDQAIGGRAVAAITFFETKCAIVRSVMRLTMASMTRASSALPASSDSRPTSRSGESSPTAAAMLRSIGSTRSGVFFETVETMPADHPHDRRRLGGHAAFRAALDRRHQLDDRWPGSAAMPSSSAIALSSSAMAPPDTQWVTMVSQLADLPPVRSRRTSA